jgi:lactate dehydrogenase-like 2-hydroxyacid dehydrogenase
MGVRQGRGLRRRAARRRRRAGRGQLQERRAGDAEVKLIQVPGAGYDGIDLKAVPRGVALCNCF